MQSCRGLLASLAHFCISPWHCPGVPFAMCLMPAGKTSAGNPLNSNAHYMVMKGANSKSRLFAKFPLLFHSASKAVMSRGVAGGHGKKLRRESAWKSSSGLTRPVRSASSRSKNRLPRLSSHTPLPNAVYNVSMSGGGGFDDCCCCALLPGLLADMMGCITLP